MAKLPLLTNLLKNKVAIILLGMQCILFASNAAAELVKGEAPNFTLKSIRGDNLKLSERRGEVIMLSFWASWCDTCKQGMPVLNDIYLRYRDEGFTLFSINIEKEPEKAKKALRDLQVSFPVLMDSTHEVSEKYEVDEMPSTYLIDRDGNLRYTHRGFPAGFDDVLVKEVRELMAE